MTDIQKQILYNKYLRGDLKLEDILPSDLKRLAGPHWLDHKYAAQPQIDDSVAFNKEIRRREKVAASKPMREIDRDFFKDDKE
jgi:hypothetical protein